MNFEVIKEPRGFMKVLQFFFAIVAFATTSGFSTRFSFHAASSHCNKTTVINHTLAYPFDLDHQSDSVDLCVGNKSLQHQVTFNYQGNAVSDSRFYVAVGVVCMFLSAALLLFYASRADEYVMSRAASIDFGVHGAVGVLLFAGSCAWADGVRVMKGAADPSLWVAALCNTLQSPHAVTCYFQPDSDLSGNFAKLNVSLILGFLNVFLWSSNMWFIYKDTVWYMSSRHSAMSSDQIPGNI